MGSTQESHQSVALEQTGITEGNEEEIGHREKSENESVLDKDFIVSSETGRGESGKLDTEAFTVKL